MQTEVTTKKSSATNKAAKQSGQQSNTAVELKGSVFTLPILQIQTTSISAIESVLVSHLSKALKFFENAPVVIDLNAIKDATEDFDFCSLMQLLSQQRLIPVGVRNGSNQQNSLAISAGLAILQDGFPQQTTKEKNSNKASSEKESNKKEAEAESRAPVIDTVKVIQNPTKIVTQPVRSGQQVYAKGGDLIIMAPVNHGAEIIADGNIHVYSTMRGRALAGVRGDVNTSIFCQSMEAELVAIAGNFRVFEEDMPAEVKSKSVRIHLDEEQLIISQL